MTPLAAKALELAVAELGVREDPPGSNRGPQVDEYIRAAGLDPTKGSYPWCACFIVYCVRQGMLLGDTIKLRRSARVLELLQRNPEAMLDRAEVGAIFIHLKPNTDGHCGFVTAVNEDGSIETIEGNSDASGSRTGGSVCRNLRPAGYATAFLEVR